MSLVICRSDNSSEHMKYAWVSPICQEKALLTSQIFYKTGRLRVAIMTANLVPYDYQDIENVRLRKATQLTTKTIFIQDFLKQGRTLESKSSETSTSLPDFPDQFRRLFSHLKIHKALRFLTSGHPEGQSMPISSDQSFADFGQYDWSRVQVRLVMSIPGVYNGLSKMATSGIGRLATVLEEEGWKPQPGDRVVAEYQVRC